MICANPAGERWVSADLESAKSKSPGDRSNDWVFGDNC
jgi:hypothetical protein